MSAFFSFCAIFSYRKSQCLAFPYFFTNSCTTQAQGGAPPTGAFDSANPFAAMMMNPMAFGGGAGALPRAGSAAPAQQPELIYAAQLRQLQDMGFYDAPANIQALVSTGGDVNAAVAILLG